MIRNSYSGIGILFLALTLISCGQKEESTTSSDESKIKEAVEKAATRELKLYEGAKQSLDKIEEQTAERREMEKELAR